MGSVADFRSMIGQSIGVTPWFLLTQDRVTAFGGVTLDFDPHHLDPKQAHNGPFGVPTAQGFLTLSLLTHFVESLPDRHVLSQHINYGLNRVRFVRPAVVGRRLRATFEIVGAVERAANAYMLTMGVQIMAEDEDVPVMTAEWLVLVNA